MSQTEVFRHNITNKSMFSIMLEVMLMETDLKGTSTTVVYNTTFEPVFAVALWRPTSFPNVTSERGGT